MVECRHAQPSRRIRNTRSGKLFVAAHLLSILTPGFCVSLRAARRLASAVTYDVGGDAPICWVTQWPGQSNATTTRVSCPPTATMAFSQRLPSYTMGDTTYAVAYRVSFNKTSVGLVPHTVAGVSYDIPYSSIKSCYGRVGFCTPFVNASSGISVDGQVFRGNMQSNGSVHSFNIHTTLKLDPGFYTNLAHVRWYTKSGLLYDMASKWAFEFTPFHRIWSFSLSACACSMVSSTEPYPQYFDAPPTEVKTSPYVNMLMILFVALSEAILVGELAFLVWYRKHKVLKYSQVKILILMVIAGIVTAAGCLLYGIPTSLSCRLRPWVVVIPVNFMWGLLFGKTWRIWRLMSNKSLKAMKIGVDKVFMVAFGTIVMEIFLNGLQLIIGPLKATPELVNNETQYMFVCRGRGLNAIYTLHNFYALLILMVGVWIANKSSSLTTLFNEGKYINFSIYTCAVLAILTVPTSWAISNDPDVLYCLTVCGVCTAVVATCSSIVVPKYFLVRSGVDISVANEERHSTASAHPRSPGGGPAVRPSNPSPATSPTGGGGGGGGAEGFVVKDSIPSALRDKVEKAHDLLHSIVERQQQGYALNRPDLEAAIVAVKALHTDFEHTKLADAPPAPPAAAGKSSKRIIAA